MNHLMDVWVIYYFHTKNLKSGNKNTILVNFQLKDNNKYSCLLSRSNKIAAYEEKIPLKGKTLTSMYSGKREP